MRPQKLQERRRRVRKTILVVGEQGFGDAIQFARFFNDLSQLGSNIIFLCLPGLVPLFESSPTFKVVSNIDDVGEYDYWAPMMSLPGVLNVTLENLKHYQYYLLWLLGL